MTGTASIRMATRWSSSEHCVRALVPALSFALIALASACVTSQSSHFVPTPGEARLTTDEARDALDLLLAPECARLVTDRRETAEARVALEVDRSGTVQRSRIARSTGDERIDQIIGAVTARLQFEAPAGEFRGATAPGNLRVGYSCSAAGAAVATLQVL